jgi:WD40 repeat protein
LIASFRSDFQPIMIRHRSASIGKVRDGSKERFWIDADVQRSTLYQSRNHRQKQQICESIEAARRGEKRERTSGSDDRTLRFWDLETAQLLRPLEGHAEGVRTETVTAEGCKTVPDFRNRPLRLWDLDSDQMLRALDCRNNNWPYNHGRKKRVLFVPAVKIQSLGGKSRPCGGVHSFYKSTFLQ